jgi:hypothetical protein
MLHLSSSICVYIPFFFCGFETFVNYLGIFLDLFNCF